MCKIPISVRGRDVQTMRYHKAGEEGAFIESRSGRDAFRKVETLTGIKVGSSITFALYNIIYVVVSNS